MGQPFKNILVIRLSALGDVVMTIPVVYPVCRAYPDCKFTLLTSSAARQLFVDAPENLDIVPVDTKNQYRGVRGIFKLFFGIKERNFDAVADLHDVLRSKLLRFLFSLTGAKTVSIDKGRKEKQRLVNHEKGCFVQLKSSFERYADVFRQLGFRYSGNFTPVGASDCGDLPERLVRNGLSGEKWIGIAPVSKHRGKNYPAQKMEQIVKLLSEKGGYRIFLLGSPLEKELFESWCASYDNVFSLVPERLGFAREMKFIKQLDLLVSMDSANMHIASILGTPVLSIWGATHPYAGFLGWGLTENSVMQRDIACRPCSIFGSLPCYKGNYECLDIPPESVAERIACIVEKNDEKGNK